MSLEKENPNRSAENIERQLEQESTELEMNVGNVNASLDKVEASSSDRQKKILDFINRNWFTIMGGSAGAGGIFGLGEGLISGNWERLIVSLALGAGAGKALELAVKRSVEKSKNLNK